MARTLFGKTDYVKQLVLKNHSVFNFDIAKSRLDEFLGQIIKRDGTAEIVFYTCQAYAKLSKLLHTTEEGLIKAEDGREIYLGEKVRSLANQIEDDENRYLAYFAALIKMGEGPITEDVLSDRYAKLKKLPDLKPDEKEEALNPEERAKREDERIKKRKALKAAYSVLSVLVERNDGILENPGVWLDVEAKAYYDRGGQLRFLSDTDMQMFSQLNDAKKEAVKKFVPSILLRSKNDITAETIRDNYEELLAMLPYGDNTDFMSLAEIEKLYYAIHYAVAENGGKIPKSQKESILNSYEKHMPKANIQAAVAMLFHQTTMLTQESLNEKMKMLARKEDGVSEIEDKEMLVALEVAYCIILKAINDCGGMCEPDVARAKYMKTLSDIENKKAYHRKETKSPFKMYPISQEDKFDDLYLNYLQQALDTIAKAAKDGNIDDVLSQAALVQVQREMYDIVNDPTKRRELLEVNFDVVAPNQEEIFPICELHHIRESNPKEILNIENSVGDEIIVTRIGKLGFGAMRKADGTPMYGEPFSTFEYEVRKIYHSTAVAGKEPEQRTFRVFSGTIFPEDIMNDPRLYAVYANQIFSDLSLDTAIEKNSRVIASAHMEEHGNQKVPSIGFSNYGLNACRKLESVYADYERATRDRCIQPRLAKRMKDNNALIGNSSVKLRDGYGTRIMIHKNGEREGTDRLCAFEWSDILKTNTILDTITGSLIER